MPRPRHKTLVVCFSLLLFGCVGHIDVHDRGLETIRLRVSEREPTWQLHVVVLTLLGRQTTWANHGQHGVGFICHIKARSEF